MFERIQASKGSLGQKDFFKVLPEILSFVDLEEAVQLNQTDVKSVRGIVIEISFLKKQHRNRDYLLKGT